MKKKTNGSATAAKSTNVVDLRLYVAGSTPRSMAAISNLKQICCKYHSSQYRIEVIDLLKNPALARDHQILAIPTLVRSLPVPIRKIIGDLSDTERVIVGLDIKDAAEKKAATEKPLAKSAGANHRR